jgi:hypothetical protein
VYRLLQTDCRGRYHPNHYTGGLVKVKEIIEKLNKEDPESDVYKFCCDRFTPTHFVFDDEEGGVVIE